MTAYWDHSRRRNQFHQPLVEGANIRLPTLQVRPCAFGGKWELEVSLIREDTNSIHMCISRAMGLDDLMSVLKQWAMDPEMVLALEFSWTPEEATP